MDIIVNYEAVAEFGGTWHLWLMVLLETPLADFWVCNSWLWILHFFLKTTVGILCSLYNEYFIFRCGSPTQGACGKVGNELYLAQFTSARESADIQRNQEWPLFNCRDDLSPVRWHFKLCIFHHLVISAMNKDPRFTQACLFSVPNSWVHLFKWREPVRPRELLCCLGVSFKKKLQHTGD